MALRVEIYTSGGMANGDLARSGSLRDILGAEPRLQLERSLWQGFDDPSPRPMGTQVIAVDDIVFALADEHADPPVHAAWHHVVLEAGPYTMEGELATLPGFDPGRSLARPSGEFVLLRDVQVTRRDRPDAGASTGDHVLVNRYAVEVVKADLMLGFFFPGAAMLPTAVRSAPPTGRTLGGVA